MKLSTITSDRVDDVLAFWHEHHEVSDTETVDNLNVLINSNPELSVLALNEDNSIVGTLLVSSDDNMGYMQKIVVHKDHRGQGIGKELIEEGKRRLNDKGVVEYCEGCADNVIPVSGSCRYLNNHL